MNITRQRVVVIIFGCVLLTGVVAPVRAEEEERRCAMCIKASDDAASYSEKAGNTLTRGAANTLLGWTDVIRQPAKEVKEGGNIVTGLGKGLGQGVMRTLEGLGEVVTFWTPKIGHHYVHFSKDCPVCRGKSQ